MSLADASGPLDGTWQPRDAAAGAGPRVVRGRAAGHRAGLHRRAASPCGRHGSADARAASSPDRWPHVRGRSGLRFTSRAGRVGLRYGGLQARDAAGRRLPATLSLRRGRLVIAVDDRGARYPVTIDPLVQQGAKLTPSDESGPGSFGVSVALSADGNTALVGGDSDARNNGAAWVFTRRAGTWSQQGGEAHRRWRDRAARRSARAWRCRRTATPRSSAATSTAPAAPAPRGCSRASGTTWTQQGTKLTGAGATSGAGFGSSVALSARRQHRAGRRPDQRLGQRRGRVGLQPQQRRHLEPAGLDAGRDRRERGRRVRHQRGALGRRRHGARRRRQRHQRQGRGVGVRAQRRQLQPAGQADAQRRGRQRARRSGRAWRCPPTATRRSIGGPGDGTARRRAGGGVGLHPHAVDLEPAGLQAHRRRRRRGQRVGLRAWRSPQTATSRSSGARATAGETARRGCLTGRARRGHSRGASSPARERTWSGRSGQASRSRLMARRR